MLNALKERFDETRVLIMAAAPADFRPALELKRKIKKEEHGDSFSLELVKTPDILAELSRLKGDRLLVGFALETDDGLQNARRKLKDKSLDMIVLNQPESSRKAGLGKDAIQPTVIFADGEVIEHPVIPKTDFARILLDEVQKRLPA
jgi:phosphopantothenoylcysteine decarboxylase/phosphopantothenate--cysteine ligase